MAVSLANVEVYLPSKKPDDKRLTPVIFLHPLLVTKEIWEDIPRKVADQTNRVVYTYDAPCHGTRIDDTEFSYNVIFDYLESMMRELNIEKAILVGHSMGGKTAIRAALTRFLGHRLLQCHKIPGKVEKVFILDMHTAKIPKALIDRFINFMRDWRAIVRQISTSEIIEDFLKKSTLEVDGEFGPSAVISIYLTSYIKKEKAENESYLNSRFLYKKGENNNYDVRFNVDAIMEGLKQYKREKHYVTGQYDGPSYFLYSSGSFYKVNMQLRKIQNYFTKVEMIPFSGDSYHVFTRSPDKFLEVLVAKINLSA